MQQLDQNPYVGVQAPEMHMPQTNVQMIENQYNEAEAEQNDAGVEVENDVG